MSRSVAAIAVCLALLSPAVVGGAPSPASRQWEGFSKVVVFGDSLSDTGNLYSFMAPSMPSGWWAPAYPGRLSDGPVAVEHLANRLGVPLEDYAWDGAVTGPGVPLYAQVPTMFAQLDTYLTNAGGVADPRAVYVVWGGPNDFANVDANDEAALLATTQASISNQMQIVRTLQQAGAVYILVPGMFNLGKVPDFEGELRTDVSRRYNVVLKDALRFYGPTVRYVDTFSVIEAAVLQHDLYGFTNTTDSCVQDPACLANPHTYIFWQGAHLTSTAYQLIANAMAATLIRKN